MGRKAKKEKTPMAQVSICILQRLVDIIDEMAVRDNRSRSNFIAHRLQVLADKHRDLESIRFSRGNFGKRL